MAVCENCGEPLDSRWKFCIHCGTRIERMDPVSAIPAAIRPQDAPPARTRRLDWQVALGVAFAAIGVAMIVYLVVVLIVPHAG